MKKLYSALLFAALFSTGAMAQNESKLITEPAAGKTVNLYRTTTGYESVYYYGIPHESTGDWQRLVFGNIEQTPFLLCLRSGSKAQGRWE